MKVTAPKGQTWGAQNANFENGSRKSIPESEIMDTCHSQSKTWSHLGNDYLTLVCHIRGMKIPRIHFCTISFQQNPWIYIQSCLKRCFWNHHVILVIWPKWCKMMQSMINYFIWILTEIRIFFFKKVSDVELCG